MILTNVEVPDCVPERIKKPLGLLTGEVQDLHYARCLFWDLCIDAPETVALINRTAPCFFRRLHRLRASGFRDREAGSNPRGLVPRGQGTPAAVLPGRQTDILA